MDKFFVCKNCGKIILELEDNKKIVCEDCGVNMEELIPNTTEAATEKHLPVVNVSGKEVLVKVGEVEHPMLENHYISAIFLKTNKGIYSLELGPNQKPEASFTLKRCEKPVCAYAYCNLHGLWKTDVK